MEGSTIVRRRKANLKTMLMPKAWDTVIFPNTIINFLSELKFGTVDCRHLFSVRSPASDREKKRKEKK